MMLNIIIIIIVLLLTYFFLFKSQKESFQVPRDFYELDNLNDSQFTKINENLQEYPNSISEIVNIVKNKKIIAAYERRATPDSEESEKRLDYNIKVKLSKPRASSGDSRRRINSSITILSPESFNLENKLESMKLKKNDMVNVSWTYRGKSNSINVILATDTLTIDKDLPSLDNDDLGLKSKTMKETLIEVKDDKLPNIPYSFNVDFIITKLGCNFDESNLQRDLPKTKLEALKLCAGDGKNKYTNNACTWDYCRDFIDNTTYNFTGGAESERTCKFDASQLEASIYEGLTKPSEKKLKCIQTCTESGNDFCTFKKCKSLCESCDDNELCPWTEDTCSYRPKGVRLLDCIKDCQNTDKNCNFDKCEKLCRMCRNPERCKWYRPPTCKHQPKGTMLSDCIDGCIDFGSKNTKPGDENACTYRNCKASCESCQNPTNCSWIVPKVIEQKCEFMPWGPNKQACVDRCVSSDNFKWGGKSCTLAACTQACDSCSNDEQCKWLKEPEIDPNIELDNKDRPPVQRIRALGGSNRIFIQWKQNINNRHPTIGYILQYFKTYRPIEGVTTKDMDISSNDILEKKNLEFELTNLPKDEYTVSITAVNENGPGRASNVVNIKVPGLDDNPQTSKLYD